MRLFFKYLGLAVEDFFVHLLLALKAFIVNLFRAFWHPRKVVVSAPQDFKHERFHNRGNYAETFVPGPYNPNGPKKKRRHRGGKKHRGGRKHHKNRHHNDGNNQK